MRRQSLQTCGCLAAGLVALAAWSAHAEDKAQALLHCRVTDNGAPAGGKVRLRGLTPEATQAVDGSCGSSLRVAAGEYEVSVQLDGALDRPTQQQRLTLRAGENRMLPVEFATASLTVMVEAQGKRAAALVQVLRDGKPVGEVGAGVPVRLGVGEYSIVARYRDQTQPPQVVRLVARESRQVQISF